MSASLGVGVPIGAGEATRFSLETLRRRLLTAAIAFPAVAWSCAAAAGHQKLMEAKAPGSHGPEPSRRTPAPPLPPPLT